MSPNFVPVGRTWNHRILTYFFQNGTNDITGNSERQAIRDGFAIWAAESNLEFLEVCSASQADIVILWGSFGHGDPVPACYPGIGPFDGVNGTLAHNMGGPAPNNCGGQAADIHFDESETWTLNIRNSNQQPIDLVSVAAHEIGHALGLAHTTVAGSLMLATYTGSHRFLGSDDVAGIQSLYGVSNPSLISGPDLFCTSATYSLPASLPSGISVQWSASPSNRVSISSNGTSATITKISNGDVSITATITACSGQQVSITRNIHVGPPSPSGGITEISMECDAGGGGTAMGLYEVGHMDETTAYHWSVYPESDAYIWEPATEPYVYIEFYQPGYYTVSLWVETTCGDVIYPDLEVEVPYCNYNNKYVIYPNPAQDRIRISRSFETPAPSQVKSRTNEDYSFHYKLYDEQMELWIEGDSNKGGNTEINISHIPANKYFLHIIDADGTIKKQVFVAD